MKRFWITFGAIVIMVVVVSIIAIGSNKNAAGPEGDTGGSVPVDQQDSTAVPKDDSVDTGDFANDPVGTGEWIEQTTSTTEAGSSCANSVASNGTDNAGEEQGYSDQPCPEPVAPVPELPTSLLIAVGALGVAIYLWQKKRKHSKIVSIE